MQIDAAVESEFRLYGIYVRADEMPFIWAESVPLPSA